MPDKLISSTVTKHRHTAAADRNTVNSVTAERTERTELPAERTELPVFNAQ